MNSVHPTAIIGAHVHLGTGNTVGPFAIIGGNVEIGDRNWIGAGSKIGAPPEVRSFDHPASWIDSADSVGVTLGDDNVVREDVHIHSGWQNRTRLGSRLFVMNRVYIAHDCVISDGVTIASSVAIGGHVQIGHSANIGLASSLHQRRIIGPLAMVGMSSVVTRDIPPYAKAYGNPCRVQGANEVGMSRAGIDDKTIESVKRSIGLESYLTEVSPLFAIAADIEWFQRAKRA